AVTSGAGSINAAMLTQSSFDANLEVRSQENDGTIYHSYPYLAFLPLEERAREPVRARPIPVEPKVVDVAQGPPLAELLGSAQKDWRVR
ncbi:MAG: hypothetical protein RLZZ387_4671, partial [Chloroflexota bacterium]